ncbi:MAG: cell wall hydrolase [Lachnospiraceae bacterium]|nr:cell wall hydrolase [Lachnospiraceae bacterium]
MKGRQITGLLVLTFIWLTTCGFVSWGEAANAGIADVVEPMTSEQFENYEVLEEWRNLCMPNVKEYVTIRSEASAESEAVGRLYKGGAAEVLEQGNEWTKVVSGDCEGYISNEYLEFGADAKEIAERDCSYVATITADTLKIRAEASEDSKTRDLIGLGEKVNVLDEEDGWLKIEYGEEGAYIKAEYATVEFEVGEAQTMEQIKAAEEAAEAARKKAELKKNYEAVKASGNEVQLLGALIQIESGNQPYEGQLAVGAVVMNRVRSGRYPNTIADVIYAAGQFPYASTKVHEVMARGVKASCLQAAQEAINGVSNIGSFTHFKSAGSSVNGASIVIGGHVFY